MSLTLAFQINRFLILHTFSQHHPPYILLYYADKNQTTYSDLQMKKSAITNVNKWLHDYFHLINLQQPMNLAF